jgi:hypothetical protein
MRWALLWGLLIGLVLLPFFLFEAQFNALAEQITRSGISRSVAAAGIFTLLALDVFLPVPSSIVATGAGVILGLIITLTILFVASEFQEPLKVTRLPDSAGTISAARLRHRIPKEALKAYEGAVKTSSGGLETKNSVGQEIDFLRNVPMESAITNRKQEK